MTLKNFLARVTGSRRDGPQRQTRAGSLDNFLPGLRPVVDEVDTYFDDVFAAPAHDGPTKGGAPPASGRRSEMRAPKLLPWVARKAGINDELALKLWRRAAGESEVLCGNCDSADYYAAAMSRFLDLVEGESETFCREPAAGVRTSWIWRHERRMSQLNMAAAQEICRLWQSNWLTFFAAQKPSALRLR